MSAYVVNARGELTKKPKRRLMDPQRAYILEAQSHALLSAEEEAVLIQDYQQNKNPRALDRVIKSHLRLLIRIAQGYMGYGYALEDLISEGHVGMMHAIKGFEPGKGARFSTYATWWIRASIQDYVLKSWSLVKLSSGADSKKLFYKLRSTKQSLGLDRFQSLSDEEALEISRILEVPMELVIEMDHRLNGVDFSLNAYIQSEEGSEWQDWLPSDGETHDEQLANEDETQKRSLLLAQALITLNDREMQILKWRRLEDPKRSLEEIGLELNLSRERIRQIEEIAFEKVQRLVLHQAAAKGMSH